MPLLSKAQNLDSQCRFYYTAGGTIFTSITPLAISEKNHYIGIGPRVLSESRNIKKGKSGWEAEITLNFTNTN